jgi:hypothetical protein
MIGIALFMIVPPLVLVAIPTVLYLTIPKRKSPVTLGFILAGIHLALVLYVAAPADSAGIGSESFGRSEAIPSRKSERTPGPIPNPVLGCASQSTRGIYAGLELVHARLECQDHLDGFRGGLPHACGFRKRPTTFRGSSCVFRGQVERGRRVWRDGDVPGERPLVVDGPVALDPAIDAVVMSFDPLE